MTRMEPEEHGLTVRGIERMHSALAYNETMRGWSFPLGRWWGMDIRIHTFFLLLLGVCMGHASMLQMPQWHGFMLWLLLFFAVLVREIGRVIAAAYNGLQIRSMLLLPIGGLMSFANAESVERSNELPVQLKMAVVGPLVSLSMAALCVLTIVGAAPKFDLLLKPLITPAHLIRSFVWLNAFLGVLHLLPAYPLDAGRVLRSQFTRVQGHVQAARAAAGLGLMIGVIAILLGILLPSLWLATAGFFIFIGAQMEDQGAVFQSVVDTVHMRDIMLTDFSLLSPSDTLEDALSKAVHSLQDDFPVVRGHNLVGVVSRQVIADALRAEGNGYVQGIMQRSFHIAKPEDSLGTTISRFSGRGMSLVPVTDGERVVGIVTLQNLMHSMSQFAEKRKRNARAE
jgi:CBS domain-containing protein/Zn-dependent protease